MRLHHVFIIIPSINSTVVCRLVEDEEEKEHENVAPKINTRRDAHTAQLSRMKITKTRRIHSCLLRWMLRSGSPLRRLPREPLAKRGGVI